MGEFVDYNECQKEINELKERYEFLSVSSIGRSLLSKNIPFIRIGNGKKSVLYIGSHHGSEWITSGILLKFVKDFCEMKEKRIKPYKILPELLMSLRTIYIVPMLNPDGVDISLYGPEAGGVLKERIEKMNNGTDFSHWQANARGVDLNHNYNAGFFEYKQIERELQIESGAPTRFSGESPESESEVASLCNFVRINDISACISFHSQGEEIYYTGLGKKAENSLYLGHLLSKMTGYKLSEPSKTASYGGFSDWFINEYNRPSFTIECGKGKNPLPYSDLDRIYKSLREALFTFPTLI